jgi:hypothetical protein
MTSSTEDAPVGLVSSVIYTSIAAAAAGLFLVATFSSDEYGSVARFGGAAWVFLLSMIILMPTVTPIVRRLLTGASK